MTGIPAPGWLRGPGVVCAHRGASADEPENTLVAARAAMATGITLIECDVHLSADGVPVVLHDATLDRTTDLCGPVVARTAAALAVADAGGWRRADRAGEPLPTLAALLRCCRGRAGVLVELKPDAASGSGLVEAVAAVVAAEKVDDAVALLAFDHRHLVLAASVAPSLPRVALVGSAPTDPSALLRAAAACALGPAAHCVDSRLVTAVHDVEAAVVTWTVDDPADAIRLAEQGVDVIVSNRPATVATALRAR